MLGDLQPWLLSGTYNCIFRKGLQVLVNRQ